MADIDKFLVEFHSIAKLRLPKQENNIGTDDEPDLHTKPLLCRYHHQVSDVGDIHRSSCDYTSTIGRLILRH